MTSDTTTINVANPGCSVQPSVGIVCVTYLSTNKFLLLMQNLRIKAIQPVKNVQRYQCYEIHHL